VQQSVTFFPVLVRLENEDGALMPGMNSDVSILVDQRDGVLAVPLDAVRTPRDAAAAATALGLDPQAVRAQLQAARGGAGGRPGADAAPSNTVAVGGAAGDSGGRRRARGGAGGAGRAGAGGGQGVGPAGGLGAARAAGRGAVRAAAWAPARAPWCSCARTRGTPRAWSRSA
jgi:HlyD family secretion protein